VHGSRISLGRPLSYRRRSRRLALDQFAAGLDQLFPRTSAGSFGNVCSMVKELVSLGFDGHALLDEVIRLTGLPPPDAQRLIKVELLGVGDTGRVGGRPTLSEVAAKLEANGWLRR